MADANVGTLLSTTLKNYQKTLTDNIHKSNAVFNQLKKMGAMKSTDGGERLVEPLMYGKNTTVGSYSGYDTLDTTPQEGIDSAEFNWKQYSASITISGKEERQNNGVAKIIDLLEAKTTQAEMSLKEELSIGLFSNGTANGSKQLTGLGAMILDSGTYGGINSATYTWWQAYVESASEALALTKMRTAYNTASIGGSDTPTIAVTTQALYEKYEGLFTGTITMYSSMTKDVVDGGFQTLEFKGIPLTWDEQAVTGEMLFLNSKHMKLRYHPDANFETSQFVKPENQDAKVAQILWMGNLTCNRRKSFAKLTAKT